MPIVIIATGFLSFVAEVEGPAFCGCGSIPRVKQKRMKEQNKGLIVGNSVIMTETHSGAESWNAYCAFYVSKHMSRISFLCLELPPPPWLWRQCVSKTCVTLIQIHLHWSFLRRRKKFSQDTGLYNPRLMGSDPRFGDIGVRVGTTFESRCASPISQRPIYLTYALCDLQGWLCGQRSPQSACSWYLWQCDRGCPIYLCILCLWRRQRWWRHPVRLHSSSSLKIVSHNHTCQNLYWYR